jgi:hypothetical protein
MRILGLVLPTGLPRELQLRRGFHVLLAIFICSALLVTAQASVPLETQTGILSDSQPLISFWSTFARELAPKVGVFAFGIISLATLLFVSGRAWLLRPKAVDPALAERQRAAASFWLPASVLFGAVSGIIIGTLAALLAPVFRAFGGRAQQMFSVELDSAIFALVGAVLLAALLQYAYEVFFGWAPHRGKMKEQPYKYRVRQLSHRAGVLVGTPVAILVLVVALITTTASIPQDLTGLQKLNIAIYLSIMSIAAAIVFYWVLRLLGWLLEGDVLLFVGIALFVSFYWIYRIKRFLFGGSGPAYPTGSNLPPMRPLQRVDVEGSYELQRYRDQRFLWIPVFLILMGMLHLLVLPLIGAILLIAGAICILYYLKI